MPSVGSIVFNPLSHKTTTNYDLNNSSLIVSKTQEDFSYDSYGNITQQNSTISSINGSDTRTETTYTVNEYNYDYVNDWWLDKLSKTIVSKSATNNTGEHITTSLFKWQPNTQRKLDCQVTALGDFSTTQDICLLIPTNDLVE